MSNEALIAMLEEQAGDSPYWISRMKIDRAEAAAALRAADARIAELEGYQGLAAERQERIDHLLHRLSQALDETTYAPSYDAEVWRRRSKLREEILAENT